MHAYHKIIIILIVVPGEPKSFTFRAMSSSSIVLSWEEVECLQRHGTLTGYQLHRDDGTIISTNASRRSIAVSGLSPFTTYSFKVAAMGEAGVGPFIQINGILELQLSGSHSRPEL